jgi:hypothetical protein
LHAVFRTEFAADSLLEEMDSTIGPWRTSVGPVIENGETFASARPQAIPQYDAAGMLASALS